MMTPAKLSILAIVTAVAVAAAVVSVQSSQATLSQADRGKPYLPGLIDKINSIDSISIIDGAGTTELRRDGDRFVDVSGYPIRIEAVRNLLTGLSMLAIEERKTDRPERFSDLELAAPDASDGAGRQVVLQAGGSTVADVVVGGRDNTVGGTRGGLFVRRTANAPAYLLRGDVPLPGSRSGWFDSQLFELAKDKVRAVQINAAQGEPIELAQSTSSKTLVLDNLPAGRSADPAKVQRVATLGSGISFEDVRKATGKASGQSLTVIGAEQMRFVVSPLENFDIEDAWVQVRVQADSLKQVAQAKKENARFEGFEFKLSRYNAEPLNWKLGDVLNAPAPDATAGKAPASPALPAMNPPMPAPAAPASAPKN